MLREAKDLTRSLLMRVGLNPKRKPPFLERRFRWRGSAALRRALGSELGAMVRWPANDDELTPVGDVGRLFYAIDHVHKWEHYLPIYEQAFAPLRAKPGRFLEIGVGRGGSLEMWRRFFAPGSVIVGIDVNPACLDFPRSNDVHVRIGSQVDSAFLAQIVRDFGPFDAILDDGSHRTSHQITTFKILFASGLKDGGVYMVEDVHSNYWPSFRDSALSFVDFTKWLIDAMHAHYIHSAKGGEALFRVGSEQRRPSFDVPRATVLIDKIEVYDSVIVVGRSKGGRSLPRSIQRYP